MLLLVEARDHCPVLGVSQQVRVGVTATFEVVVDIRRHEGLWPRESVEARAYRVAYGTARPVGADDPIELEGSYSRRIPEAHDDRIAALMKRFERGIPVHAGAG